MATMRAQSIAAAVEILERLPLKYAALAALGITTGGRISELLPLRRRDLINAAEMRLRDEIAIPKHKIKRRANIADQLREMRAEINDLVAPRNIFGHPITPPPTPPRPRRAPKRYRRFIIPPEIRHYIEAHLNAEAREGYILPDDYVFRGQNGEPLKTKSAWKYFTTHIGAGYGTHWMRKTYATFMYQTFLTHYGGDSYRAAREVQMLLGHSSLETTGKYLALDTQSRAATIAAAFADAFPAPRPAGG